MEVSATSQMGNQPPRNARLRRNLNDRVTLHNDAEATAMVAVGVRAFLQAANDVTCTILKRQPATRRRPRPEHPCCELAQGHVPPKHRGCPGRALPAASCAAESAGRPRRQAAPAAAITRLTPRPDAGELKDQVLTSRASDP